MDNWRILKTPPAHGAWNMAVDEAILEAAGRGESLPTLRLYAWEPACLSLGYAQPYTDVDLPALQKLGWELVRRPTGGRAVLHTNELTYSVAAPHSEMRVAGTVLEAYRRLAEALVESLRLLGLEAEMHTSTASHREDRNNPVCFEVPSAYEITFRGRKLIGSAQARRKDGVLQHGSLPLTGDLRHIVKALVFPDEIARHNAVDRLVERAVTMEEALGHAVSWEDVSGAIVSAFGRVLNLELKPEGLSQMEEERVKYLTRTKYGSTGWMEK